MKIAYVAGPYRAKTIRGIVENINKAEAVALELWKLGFMVFCPHKNSGLFDGDIPDENFLDGDIELMKRCDLVVMIPDWEKSTGAVNEKKIAEEVKIPVFYWPVDMEKLATLVIQNINKDSIVCNELIKLQNKKKQENK
jgi:hypothetical protein